MLERNGIHFPFHVRVYSMARAVLAENTTILI